jgi:uncharacterized membrane protein
MQTGQFLYLPLAPAFFLILIVAFVALIIVLEFRVIRYAYMQLGVSSRTAMVLLFGSLIGSYFNIPVAQIPNPGVLSSQEVAYFGIHYQVPLAVEPSSTIIAVNVGGAVIPVLMSLWLLGHYKIWLRGGIAIIAVAGVCYFLASPVPGIGIAIPIFVPAIVTAIVAFALDRNHVAPLAYIAGSLGTLIGADLMNLDKVAAIGAPVASIGGAGTFDGIFMTSILAVLLGSVTGFGAVRST